MEPAVSPRILEPHAAGMALPAMPAQLDERAARGWARLILRRAGIVPLAVAGLALALTPALVRQASARPSGVSVQAEARVTILPSHVRVENGRVHSRQGSPGDADRPQAEVEDLPPPRVAPCPAGEACRLIIRDMP